MPVAWSPGGATGTIPLVLSAHTPKVGAAVACSVLASDGTFTIPPYALLALPSTGGGAFLSFGPGDLLPIGSAGFTASGLNLGIAQVAIQNAPAFNFSLQ